MKQTLFMTISFQLYHYEQFVVSFLFLNNLELKKKTKIKKVTEIKHKEIDVQRPLGTKIH